MGKRKRKASLIRISVVIILAIFSLLYFNPFNAKNTDVKINKMSVKPYKKKIEEKEYDVIVVGGEPEGVAAAVSAARNGMKVLLVERRESLGGLLTYGMLNYLDIPQNENHEVLSKGIFKEWRALVGGDNVYTVDIEESKKAFLKLVQNEKNITLSLTTDIQDVLMNENKIVGIKTIDENGEKEYLGKRIIDATPDADIAKMSGVPYFIGQQDIGKEDKMAVTLMIHLRNVNWDSVKKAAKDGILGGGGANDTAAWGFGEVLREYEEVEEDTTVRGLNIGKTPSGEVFINALQLFNVDGLSESSKQQAIDKGVKEIQSFLPWLQKNLPGFEHAEIISIPDELYVRETRHIEAEYQLQVSDLWENKHHWDDIAIGGYPSDIQATAKTNTGNIIVTPSQYGIPFRSIVPLSIDNLLVTSKASGYSSLAAGSARIIPTGMSVAEAGGIATAMSIDTGIGYREIIMHEEMIKEIQEKIKEQNGYLKQIENAKYPYKGEPYYESLKFLLRYELIAGGYNNDFYLEKEMSELAFIKTINTGLSRINKEVYKEKKEGLSNLIDNAKHEPLTLQKASDILSELGYAFDANSKEEKLTREKAYPLIADYLKKNYK